MAVPLIPLLYKHNFTFMSHYCLELWCDNFILSPLCPVLICKSTRTAIRSYKNKDIKQYLVSLKHYLNGNHKIAAILCKSSWLYLDFNTNTAEITTKLSYEQLLKSYEWISSSLNPSLLNSYVLTAYVNILYSQESFTLAAINSEYGPPLWKFELNHLANYRPITLSSTETQLTIQLYSSAIILSLISQKSQKIQNYSILSPPFKNLDQIPYINHILNKYTDTYNLTEHLLNNTINNRTNIINVTSFNETDKYISLDPMTWLNGKRENQTLWPSIVSTATPPDFLCGKRVRIPNFYVNDLYINSIHNKLEFPANSKIYYFYDSSKLLQNPPYKPQNLPAFQISNSSIYYTALRIRTDDSPRTYIPTLTKRNHVNKNSSLNSYLIALNSNSLQYVIPTSKLSSQSTTKNHPKNQSTTKNNSNIILYIVNENNEACISVTSSNTNNKTNKIKSHSSIKWISHPPTKLPINNKITTWPTHYNSILHDYIKHGCYSISDYPAPLPLGIFNLELAKNNPILIPYFINIDSIYISPYSLETHRLLTFKHQQYVQTQYTLLYP